MRVGEKLKRLGLVTVILATACSLTSGAAQILEATVEPPPVIEQAVEEFMTQEPTKVYVAVFMTELSGSIDETGGIHGSVYPGDNAADNGNFEGFMSFSVKFLSDINADIIQADLTFECEVNGNPFNDPPFGLGPLIVEVVNYGELDVEDYGVEGDRILELTECPVGTLEITDTVKSRKGQEFIQLRVHFAESNQDFYRDDVVVSSPVLVVEYREPLG